LQLVINSYGSYLRKSGNCFLVKKDEKSLEVAAGKVNSILIATSAYITTDAIKLALDNNIDIVFLDSFGEPYGRIWHPKLGSTTLIRRRQLEIYDSSKGLNLAKDWGVRKMENQIDLLSKLRKTRDEKRPDLDVFIEEIGQCRNQMSRLRGSIEARRLSPPLCPKDTAFWGGAEIRPGMNSMPCSITVMASSTLWWRRDAS